jgi:hypothetical protein
MESSERSFWRRSAGERGLEPTKRASARLVKKRLSFSAMRSETIESENFETD